MTLNVVYLNHSVAICNVVPSGVILHLLVLKHRNVVTIVFYVVCYDSIRMPYIYSASEMFVTRAVL